MARRFTVRLVTTPLRTRLKLIFLVLAAAVLFAACGGDDLAERGNDAEETNVETDQAQDTEASTADETEEVVSTTTTMPPTTTTTTTEAPDTDDTPETETTQAPTTAAPTTAAPTTAAPSTTASTEAPAEETSSTQAPSSSASTEAPTETADDPDTTQDDPGAAQDPPEVVEETPEAPPADDPVDEVPESSTVPEAPAPDGAALYASNCAFCHGADGSGRSSSGIQGVAEATTQSATINGRAQMPSFPDLSGAQVAAIASHVASL